MIGAIWAQSLDGVIGDGTTMPWHIPEDLRHFKEVTLGQPIIMGRRTWESLPRRPLPGRANFVLSSRDPGPWSEGATVVTTVPAEGWIIGGGEVYAATLEVAEVLEVTLIDTHLADTVDTPVFAPAIPADFHLAEDGDWLRSAEHRYKFQTYRRSTP